MTVRQGFVVVSIALLLLVAVWAMYWSPAIWFYVPLLMLIALGIHDMFQHSHTVLRLYPVVGHVRYLFESVRKEIQQYFVESDTDGMPVTKAQNWAVLRITRGRVA